MVNRGDRMEKGVVFEIPNFYDPSNTYEIEIITYEFNPKCTEFKAYPIDTIIHSHKYLFCSREKEFQVFRRESYEILEKATHADKVKYKLFTNYRYIFVAYSTGSNKYVYLAVHAVIDTVKCKVYAFKYCKDYFDLFRVYINGKEAEIIWIDEKLEKEVEKWALAKGYKISNRYYNRSILAGLLWKMETESKEKTPEEIARISVAEETINDRELSSDTIIEEIEAEKLRKELEEKDKVIAELRKEIEIRDSEIAGLKKTIEELNRKIEELEKRKAREIFETIYLIDYRVPSIELKGKYKHKKDRKIVIYNKYFQEIEKLRTRYWTLLPLIASKSEKFGWYTTKDRIAANIRYFKELKEIEREFNKVLEKLGEPRRYIKLIPIKIPRSTLITEIKSRIAELEEKIAEYENKKHSQYKKLMQIAMSELNFCKELLSRFQV